MLLSKVWFWVISCHEGVSGGCIPIAIRYLYTHRTVPFSWESNSIAMTLSCDYARPGFVGAHITGWIAESLLVHHFSSNIFLFLFIFIVIEIHILLTWLSSDAEGKPRPWKGNFSGHRPKGLMSPPQPHQQRTNTPELPLSPPFKMPR